MFVYSTFILPTIGGQATKLLNLYSNSHGVTLEDKRIRTPPLSPPFKVGVFDVFIGSMNMAQHCMEGMGEEISSF